jgi:hypothetical protein
MAGQEEVFLPRQKKAWNPQKQTLPLIEAIKSITGGYERMTIRQLFYQLVSRQMIDKTEAAYDKVKYLSGKMR